MHSNGPEINEHAPSAKPRCVATYRKRFTFSGCEVGAEPVTCHEVLRATSTLRLGRTVQRSEGVPPFA